MIIMMMNMNIVINMVQKKRSKSFVLHVSQMSGEERSDGA